ncbi:MAG: hypothetical protein ACYS0G_07825 [Planctomycetota bacterium]|jgi:hypothetical protein
MKSTVRVVLLGLVSSVSAACAPVATYPPMAGVIEPSGSLNEPIRTLMVEAIRFVHLHYGQDEAFAINLPPGTPPGIYDQVIARLGAGRPMLAADDPAYHVTKVMARGMVGKVDVFYPTDDGGYQFATITFRRDLFHGYRHEDTRLWQTGDRPPAPGYIAPLAAVEEGTSERD